MLNGLSSRARNSQPGDVGLMRRLLDGRYSPVTVLSDEKYEEILAAKASQLRTRLAVIEDDIIALQTEDSEDTPSDVRSS